MFTLKIRTDNAAFHEGDMGEGEELARILHKLADALPAGSPAEGKVRDSNGNTVGEWKLTRTKP